MSLLIVLKEDGFVHMVADSQVTSRGNKQNIITEESAKLFKVKGIIDAYIGHAGYVNNKTAITNYDFGLTDKGTLSFDDVVKDVVPQLIKAYEEYSIYDKKLYEEHGSVFILIQKDKAFYIDNDFSVTEIDLFFALGSGQEFATSYLYSLDKLSPKERIIKTIKYISSISTNVSGPYKYVNTRDLEFEIIEGED